MMHEPIKNKTYDPLILVVDDDFEVRKLIQFALKKISCNNIITASNGKEAIDKVSRQMPDLILMDIIMPVMDGFKACEFLKDSNRFKHIPIIIVSSLKDIKDKAMAYRCGADDYLAKPVDIITLAARTKAILETKRLEEKIRKLSDNKAINDNLFDYKHLFERLVTELEFCRKKSLPFSVIYLDIDYLKVINMEFGHKVGDSVIREVRNILYDKVSDNGVVLSSKSDKFILYLPRVGEDKVHVLVDDILDKVRQVNLPIEFEKKVALEAMSRRQHAVTKVTLSIGIVTWDKAEGIQAPKLITLTEKALKEAKEAGRDKKVQYQFYSKPEAKNIHTIDKTVVRDYKRQDDV